MAFWSFCKGGASRGGEELHALQACPNILGPQCALLRSLRCTSSLPSEHATISAMLAVRDRNSVTLAVAQPTNGWWPEFGARRSTTHQRA